MMFSASQVTVTNLTPEVTVLTPDGAIRHLHADDKPYQDESGVEVKTHWDDSKLIVETKSERGKIKETWSVSEDPRRLQVQLDVDRPFGNSVKVKRVFDAVDPNAPKTEEAKPPAQPPADTPPAPPASNPPPPDPERR